MLSRRKLKWWSVVPVCLVLGFTLLAGAALAADSQEDKSFSDFSMFMLLTLFVSVILSAFFAVGAAFLLQLSVRIVDREGSVDYWTAYKTWFMAANCAVLIHIGLLITARLLDVQVSTITQISPQAFSWGLGLLIYGFFVSKVLEMKFWKGLIVSLVLNIAMGIALIGLGVGWRILSNPAGSGDSAQTQVTESPSEEKSEPSKEETSAREESSEDRSTPEPVRRTVEVKRDLSRKPDTEEKVEPRPQAVSKSVEEKPVPGRAETMAERAKREARQVPTADDVASRKRASARGPRASEGFAGIADLFRKGAGTGATPGTARAVSATPQQSGDSTVFATPVPSPTAESRQTGVVATRPAAVQKQARPARTAKPKDSSINLGEDSFSEQKTITLPNGAILTPAVPQVTRRSYESPQ